MRNRTLEQMLEAITVTEWEEVWLEGVPDDDYARARFASDRVPQLRDTLLRVLARHRTPGGSTPAEPADLVNLLEEGDADETAAG